MAAINRLFKILITALAALVSLRAQRAAGQEALSTQANRRAATLLQRCITCHGATKPEGGLNLTMRITALKGGVSGPALKPGDPERSLFYRRIAARQMPPGNPLSASEIEIIRRWIAGGAAWSDTGPQRAGRDWWSLHPLALPKLPTPPQLGPLGSVWPRNPIDAFVLAQLKARGMTPSPPADRATLIRRVTYDLLGVPPTPAELDRFNKDRSPNAYEALVDRLLADPRYGERWGRHWLDIVRYGESNGYERDQLRPNAWRYRDYVIDAFNRDKPYGQFITEQLAGDMLEPHTQEGIVATGFLVCGPWDEVGNNQVSDLMRARVREEEMEDRVGTVCQTFLGLTVNCARCHDHKFDPILQRDYYCIKSALEGVRSGDRSLLTPEQERQRAAIAAELRQRVFSGQEELAQIEGAARARLLAVRRPAAANTAAPMPTLRWDFEQDARETLGILNGTLMDGARVERGRLVLDGKSGYLRTPPLPFALREKTLEAWVVLPERGQGGGAALSVQTRNGQQFDAIVYGEREPGKWTAGSEFFHRTLDLHASAAAAAAPDALIHVAIVYRADNSIAVYRNGKPYAPPYTPAGAESTRRTFPAGQTEVLIGLRHTGASNGLLHCEVEEARLYDRALTDAEVAASYGAGVNHIAPAELERALTAEEHTRRDALAQQLRRLEAELKTLDEAPLVYAAVSTQPEPTHVLLRGDVESRGETVAAGGLSCLAMPSPELGLTPDAPEGMRRLRLAKWIADPANPLTARVMVNRLWHYHFGRGIVGSPNDFGFNGERPTHPELLDWLAITFLRNGGRLKPLHRLILLSNTYRQSGRYSAANAAKDADDRLLWRFPPHRLEGEAVRDAMLSVSGQLNPRRGGPSFRPFTEFVDNSHFYTLIDSPDPEFCRRTIYRINVNSAKSPLLEALDCPDPSTKTPRRAVTTTPLQALELMNSSFVMRQARCFAARLVKEAGPSLPARVTLAYHLAFSRAPTMQETAEALKFAREQGMENFCWALYNASEFLYVR
jgi:mono/diheme cytochrome c family protein